MTDPMKRVRTIAGVRVPTVKEIAEKRVLDRRIYIGNLDYSATVKDLLDLFGSGWELYVCNKPLPPLTTADKS